MKVGVATIYYKSVPLVSAIELLARVTDYIMISPIYSEVSEEEIKRLKDLKESLDLEYYVHGLFPAREDPGKSKYSLDLIKETLENTYKLESNIALIHPTRRELYRESLEILKKAVKISEDYGIELAIENKPEDNLFLRDENDFRKLLEDLPEIKLCLDTSHFFLWNGDSKRLARVIKEFRDSIAIFHIADARIGDDLQMLPGYGDINWFVVGEALGKINLKKTPLILESIYPANLIEGIKNLRHVIVDYI